MPSLARVLHQGLAADKPTADASLNQGWMYYETDTGILQQSWNGAWVAVTSPEASLLIGEVIVGVGGQPNIEFLSIPPTFRMLQLIGQGRTSGGASFATIKAQFNGDTGANYDYESLYAYNGYAYGVEQLADNGVAVFQFPCAGAPAGYASSGEARIPYYARTTFHKNTIAHYPCQRNSGSGNVLDQSVSGFWHNTAAISSINLITTSGNFVEGTAVALYGAI